jgi:hypothetical protein
LLALDDQTDCGNLPPLGIRSDVPKHFFLVLSTWKNFAVSQDFKNNNNYKYPTTGDSIEVHNKNYPLRFPALLDSHGKLSNEHAMISKEYLPLNRISQLFTIRSDEDERNTAACLLPKRHCSEVGK